MIGRFIYFAAATARCELKTVIGSPPAPQRLAIAVEFKQEVQARAGYQVALACTRYGMQRIEVRQTDDIPMYEAQVGINFMDAAKSSDEYTPVRIDHAGCQFQINCFLCTSHILNQTQQPSGIFFRLLITS